MVSPLISKKPTISAAVPNNQPARGSTIVMVGGDPNKTYTYVPQSDYQTISYSDTMKKQAQQYSTSKSTGERVAGNIYLGADKAASAYEDFVSPVTKTFDTSVVVDTGNPVKDFLANAGRGFINTVVKAPSDVVRLGGASGLSVAMLGNANNKEKREVLSTGLPNFVGAQVDSFKENPGAFVGGVAAGVVGGKVIGKAAGRVKSGKKTTTPSSTTRKQTAPSSTTRKQTAPSSTTRKQIAPSLTTRKQIAPSSTTRKQTAPSSTTRKQTAPSSTTRKQTAPQPSYKRANSNAATLEKFMRQRRAKDIAADIEIGRLNRQLSNQAAQVGKVTSVRTVRDLNTGRKTRVLDFAEPKQQTALVTAADARRPRNNSRSERARVARIVEVQKASGAIFQDMKLRRDPIPQRLSFENGLITAADARKPRNRTYGEQQRVKMVREAQIKSGAAKPSASSILDMQRLGRRRPQTGAKKTSGKQTASSSTTRKQRAYETKIQRREYIEGQPEYFIIREVPRYAAGARRPISLQIGGRKVLTLDGVLQEPSYTLMLEPVTQPRLTRMPKADSKPKAKGKGAGAKEKAKAESPAKKTVKVEFEKVDTDRFVKRQGGYKKSGSSTTRRRATSAQLKNSGTAKTADGKTIFTNNKGEQYVEVDNGNGTITLVRLKPSETASQTTNKGTSAKRRGKTITEKPAKKRTSNKTTGKQTAPSSTTRKQTAPSLTTSKQTAPSLTTRKQTAPSSTTRKQTAPSLTTSKQTAPSLTTSKQTAPSLTTRKQTAPSSTTRKRRGKTTGKSTGTKQSAEQQSQTVKKREVVRVVSGGQTNISGAAQTLSVLKKQNNNTVVDGGVTTTSQTEGTVTGSTTTNKPASTSQQTTSSRVKSAEKRETQTTGTPRARAKPKAAPAVRPKKKKPVAKTTEEDKKKQRKKIKKMKEDAFRFETVNTFGWIKDSKPAAKPRKIK